MKRRAISFTVAFLFLLILTWANVTVAAQERMEGQSTSGMPTPDEGTSRHLILGVPFVRWSEAARLNYPHKNILEPSYPAAQAMILEYWGENLNAVETPEMVPKGWHVERKKGTLNDLKRQVDENIPVLVLPALTPFAHRMYSMISLWATIKHIDLVNQGPSSGLLGRMISLEAVNKSKEIREMANDSVVVAARVVVGYDDAKRVVILHDPSFGPAWEVSFEDFEKMWGFDKNKYYTTLKPPDYVARLSRKTSAGAYAPRSPDNEVSVHYVYGYTLESNGKVQEAEKEFRAGLSLPGVSPSYLHLLHFELAILCAAAGRTEEAMAETQKSIDVFPGHAAPWKFLAAGLQKAQSGQDLGKRLEEANQKAKELCSEAAEAAVAQTLTQDFAIVGCKGTFLGY